MTEQRLAWLLKITEEHAQKRYRELRRALRNRDLNQPETATASSEAGGERLGRDDFGTAA